MGKIHEHSLVGLRVLFHQRYDTGLFSLWEKNSYYSIYFEDSLILIIVKLKYYVQLSTTKFKNLSCDWYYTQYRKGRS